MISPWKLKIRLGDIWTNEELSFPERRDAIVQRLRNSHWEFKRTQHNLYYLKDLFDELSESTDEEEFNYCWDALYDEADSDRVWIDVWSTP